MVMMQLFREQFHQGIRQFLHQYMLQKQLLQTVLECIQIQQVQHLEQLNINGQLPEEEADQIKMLTTASAGALAVIYHKMH